MPYPRNDRFVDRESIFAHLPELSVDASSQTRLALFGLGGAGYVR